MVIGDGVGDRASLIRFEQPLQSVAFVADLVFAHLVIMPALSIYEDAAESAADPVDIQTAMLRAGSVAATRPQRPILTRAGA